MRGRSSSVAQRAGGDHGRSSASSSHARTPSSGIRSCASESRSRTVTVPSSSVTSSIVNAQGVPIDPEYAEVQQLKSAAMPLLFQLREDQKSEVRSLARIIGLEKVAAMI